MKRAHRNEVFRIIYELKATNAKFSNLICEAGTDEKETSPGSGLYRCHRDYPRQWDKAFDALDVAISELNESVGRARFA